MKTTNKNANMKKPKRFCGCQSSDPICTECWKPTQLCNNWIERVTPTGIVFERKTKLTKAQEKAFAAVSKLSPFSPECQRAGKPLKSLSRMDFLRGAMSTGAFGFTKPEE